MFATVIARLTETVNSLINNIYTLLQIADNKIGTREDSFQNKTLYGTANTMYAHIHSPQFVYPPIVPVVVASSEVAGKLGSFVEIIPGNAIQRAFCINWVQYSAASANDDYYLEFYKGESGNEIKIAEDCTSRETVQSGSEDSRIQALVIPPNSRISVRVATRDSGEKTISLRVKGYTY